MIRKFRSKEDREVYFERFDKLISKKKVKSDFSEMTPYEIINYLREKDVSKNYKVLPSNKFLKRSGFISFCLIFLLFTYTVSGSGSSIQQNISVLVNKIDSKNGANDIIDNFTEYLIKGDMQTLINAYRETSSGSIDNYLELVVLLDGINNFQQAGEELNNIKSKLQEISLVRNQNDYRHDVYTLLDNLFLNGKFVEARDVLDKNQSSLGSEIIFKEKDIIYNLLTDNPQQAVLIYEGMDLASINKIEDLISYGKLSVLFNRFDNSVNSIRKVLSMDSENVDILSTINMMVSYDLNNLNNVLNSFLEQNPNDVELRLVRAIANSNDLTKTQLNMEDTYEFSKKYTNNLLAKTIRLDILTNSGRNDEALVIVNELRDIKDKNYYMCYALAKYNFKTMNYNEAMNYIIESLNLNRNFVLSYEVLLDTLIEQNKISNINYFYFKMKSLDILNTYIDKKFISKYRDNFNDVNRALEILEFADKLSIYDSDLKYQTAKIYIDQRKDAEAKQKLYEALELNEKSIYFRTLGVLCVSTGETEVGIENIRRAYELDPNDILNLNNAGAYYANVEKNIQRAFSNIKAAYEGLNESYSDYEAFIIRENYFKLESMYDETTGTSTGEEIPFIDYLY